MRKILLSCLFMIGMILNTNAQITMGMGSTNVGVAPISTYYGYSYVQQIFTKQEINANAAGNITGLKFYLDANASLANSSNWTVYLGHTSKTAFTSETDWLPVSQLTQVFSGTATNSNGVVEITFATPFPYNNTDNLVLAAKENDANYDSNDYDEAFYVYPSSSANSGLFIRDDVDNPDPASPPDGVLTDYKSATTFEGLIASPIPICPLVTYPANNSTFIELSPAITWNAVQGATDYKVSIGTTPGGTDVVNQQSVAVNTFTPSTALNIGTTYYIRVVAVGSGGESQGCSNVAFSTLPPPPTNDECIDAITLTVNPDMNCGTVTAGYTLGATDSGLIPDPCYGNPDDDVWFKFVATATSHRVSLTDIVSVGTVTDDTDTYFQVFSGACGNLSSILCSDPSSATVSNLTVGETYYVRVYSYYDTGSNQSFNICIGTFPPPPANDDCSGALVASTFPYTYVQADGAGSTNNGGFVTVCPNEMNDGTWFTFTGNGGNFDITVSMPAGSDFDPQIGVYSGLCGGLSCVDTVDQDGEGMPETISVPTVAGNTYYVNVGHYDGSTDENEGAFTINITTNVLTTSETSVNKKNISVYPNPFTDVLNISDIKDVKSIVVYDLTGRLMKTFAKPSTSIHLGELKSGVYLVNLQMNDGSVKVVKAIKK